MSADFKGPPMLAANALPTGDMSRAAVQAALGKLEFPLLASPKLDGIRAIIRDGKVYSRSMKLIPNQFIQRTLGAYETLEGLDGELNDGAENDPNAMQNSSSGVRSVDGMPDFTFHVFDTIDCAFLDQTFSRRFAFAEACVKDAGNPAYVKMVPHKYVYDGEQLIAFELDTLAAGYEGVMLRDPHGLYKQGRSTERQGWLLKWKRMEDFEAEIVGYVEQMHNGNVATKNELGRTQRLGGKGAQTGKGTFGAFVCKMPGVSGTFNVGTGKGLTDDLRRKLWAERDSLIGEFIKGESFAATGVKDKPRFPRVKKLLGVRWQGDM